MSLIIMYLYMNAKCFKTINYCINANCDYVFETMGHMVSERKKMRHGQKLLPSLCFYPTHHQRGTQR